MKASLYISVHRLPTSKVEFESLSLDVRKTRLWCKEDSSELDDFQMEGLVGKIGRVAEAEHDNKMMLMTSWNKDMVIRWS